MTKNTKPKLPVNSRYNFQRILSLCFLLIAIISLQAQQFWNITNEFPGGPKTDIILVNDSCLFVGLTNGIVKSCNDGITFVTTLTAPAIYTLFTSLQGKVFAGGNGMIYFTENSGDSWDSISLQTEYPVTRIISDTEEGLFAITGAFTVENGYVGDGVFYSEDGIVWSQRNSGLGIYTSCQQIAIDNGGRLYLAVADEFVTGNGGLFVSDNKGLLWEHIDIYVDGKGVVSDHIKIASTKGLSVSPEDSVYFSFEGVAVNALVTLNTCKKSDDIGNNSYWNVFKVFNSVSWWLDRALFNIHFAENGEWYSSNKGTSNSGSTYYSISGSGGWESVDSGLGLNIFGLRDEQRFTEKSDGTIFMVQLMDERIYRRDKVNHVPENLNYENSNQLILYPNPVRPGQQVVAGPLNDSDEMELTIFSISGVKITSGKFTGGQNSFQAPLLEGLYLIVNRSCDTIYRSILVVR
jgi:hypothetical protein